MKRVAAVWVFLLCVTDVFAVQLRPGWKKVMVPPSEEKRVTQLGGEILFRYPQPSSFGTIVYVPVDVESQLAVMPVSPAVLADVIGLPGGNIDANVGVPPTVPNSEKASYAPGSTGLYMIILVGAFTPEMLAPVVATGARAVDGIPSNGMLIMATPEQAEELRALTVVEFVEPYHPYYRCQAPSDVVANGRYYIHVQVPAPRDASLMTFLAMVAVSHFVETPRPDDVYLTILGTDYERVRRHPLAVCVSVRSVDLTGIPTLGGTAMVLLVMVVAAIALHRL